MRRSDTRTCGADIKRLGELNELDSGSVHAAKKNRYLETNARRAAALRRFHTFTLLVNLKFQTLPLGTRELVR